MTRASASKQAIPVKDPEKDQPADLFLGVGQHRRRKAITKKDQPADLFFSADFFFFAKDIFYFPKNIIVFTIGEALLVSYFLMCRGK